MVLVSAILPVDESVCDDSSRNNARIRALNEKIKSLCSSFDNCVFFDSTAKFTDETGNLRYVFHDGDGVHLNSLGYKEWIDDIRQAIKGY